MNLRNNRKQSHSKPSHSEPRTARPYDEARNTRTREAIETPSTKNVSTYMVEESTELLQWLLTTLQDKGRNKVKSILARGQVSVNGKVVTQYNHVLKKGSQVEINWSVVTGEVQIKGLDILFEDEDLVVINKQEGVLSIATPGEDRPTAYSLLMEHVRQQDPRNRIFIVHRLDRDTSGVMMFAKSEAIQQRLQNTWRETVQERTYYVVVEGAVEKEEGTITSWLKESKTLKMYSSRKTDGALKAITHYKVLQKNDDYSLLEVNLETGRKNQIRVHMQDIGHSIIGDKKYGAKKSPIGRLGLHAGVLAFRHPSTGQSMRFRTKIPAKFLRLFPKES